MAAAACGAIVSVLLARHLGPAGFGELSLIFSVAMVATGLAELGTTQVVVGEMAARRERRRQLAAALAVLRAGAGAVLATAGTLLLVVLLDDASARWAAAAILATLPLAGVTALVALHQSDLKPEVGAALSLGQSLLWLIGVALAVAIDAPLATYGLLFLGVGGAQAAACWASVPKRDAPAWREWRGAAGWLLSRAWPLAVAGVLGTLYYRVDSVFVFALAGPTEAGFYAAGYRFLDVFQLLPAAVVAVLLPVLARTWSSDDRARVARVFRLGITVMAVIATPLAVAAVMAGERVALAIFGPSYARVGAVLAVLALTTFSIATGYVYSTVVVATGQVRVLAGVAAVAAGATVLANLAVVPRWGALGAAWVTVAVEYFVSSTLALWIYRRHRLALPGSRVGAAFAAGAVMAAVAWVLRDAALPVLLGVSTVAYAGAATVLGAVRRDDLRAIFHPRLALGAREGTDVLDSPT